MTLSEQLAELMLADNVSGIHLVRNIESGAVFWSASLRNGGASGQGETIEQAIADAKAWQQERGWK